MTVAICGAATLRLADMVIPDHLSRDLRRAEEFIQLAVIASQQVLTSAPAIDGQRTGIYLGTAFGPMACNLAVLDDLVMAEPISPTLFSHSVFNAAAGYIARICKIYGPALTLTSYGWPFFQALQSAWQALNVKTIDHALVLQVETYSPLLADAKNAMLPGAPTAWPAGATAWLLGHHGPDILAHIAVAETPCPPEARLHHLEFQDKQEPSHPLAAVEELTTLINSATLPKTWSKTGSCGEVALKFRQEEG